MRFSLNICWNDISQKWWMFWSVLQEMRSHLIFLAVIYWSLVSVSNFLLILMLSHLLSIFWIYLSLEFAWCIWECEQFMSMVKWKFLAVVVKVAILNFQHLRLSVKYLHACCHVMMPVWFWVHGWFREKCCSTKREVPYFIHEHTDLSPTARYSSIDFSKLLLDIDISAYMSNVQRTMVNISVNW